MTDVAAFTSSELWSNFNPVWMSSGQRSERRVDCCLTRLQPASDTKPCVGSLYCPLSDSRDNSSLIAWIRSRAESHILHHEQLVLYHSQQLSQWTALKQTVDSASASSPASSPLSPLRSSPLKKGKGADSVREEVRRRFGSVMAGWKWEEKIGKKDRKAGKENAAVSARDIEKRIRGSAGSAAVASDSVTKTPDSRGVKFALQAVVIGEGEVPLMDDRKRKDGSAEKLRAKAQQRHDDDAAAKEQKEQPQLQQEDSCILSSPAAREWPASPKLVLPSLSGLLAERDDDGETVPVHLHDAASQPSTPKAATAPPAAPPAIAASAMTASSAAAKLSPFLQFHPSLRDHPYHQQLIQTPPPPPPPIMASSPARAPAPPAATLPTPPPPPRSLPPKKKLEVFMAASTPPPAVLQQQSSVSTVRFRVDAEMPMTADDSTTVLLHTSSGLMSPPPAPAAAAPAQVMSPPPLPPRRPAAALLSPPPQSASRAPPSGAFCYLTPSQLAVSSNGSGSAGSRHRRQRSKSVDLTAGRSS